MKRLLYLFINLLLANCLIVACSPIQAATGTLTINGNSSDFTVIVSPPPTAALAWVNNVTMTDPTSKWLGAVGHYNNLTTDNLYTHTFTSIPITGGNVNANISFPAYGIYECYVIDSGTTGILPMVPWAISTNHITVTVQ